MNANNQLTNVYHLATPHTETNLLPASLIGFCLVLLLAITGCVSGMGNKEITKDELVNKIVVGQTTKAEVKQLLGQPTDVHFADNGEEIWYYRYTRSNVRSSSFIPYAGAVVGGADTKTVTLTVRYTTDGIVKNIGRGEATGGGGGIQDSDR
jgi:outer membrane protein assembly factor BamE (lipoprotein component of BamABCDE complex)